MADSVDRVFVHALSTVKKIPKTGATRPPPAERLRLYGLYKQAMEGDVDGVMDRPTAGPGISSEDVHREKDKWDAWNTQKGLGRTEAKRRYIEALIETMHKYATTPDAKELVAELEFVWNQIKHNSTSSSPSSPKGRADSYGGQATSPRIFQPPMSGTEGPLKILSPMSEDDELERESQRRMDFEGEDNDDGDGDGDEVVRRGGTRWSRKVESALVKMVAEVAALREQISTGREWMARKERSSAAWLGWFFWVAVKHFAVDMVILGIVLLWMRRRKDRRLEDLVRAAVRIGREYLRAVLPDR